MVMTMVPMKCLLDTLFLTTSNTQFLIPVRLRCWWRVVCWGLGGGGGRFAGAAGWGCLEAVMLAVMGLVRVWQVMVDLPISGTRFRANSRLKGMRGDAAFVRVQAVPAANSIKSCDPFTINAGSGRLKILKNY